MTSDLNATDHTSLQPRPDVCGAFDFDEAAAPAFSELLLMAC
jgi:hypothetical protein